MSASSICAVLGVEEEFAEPLRQMVDWSAADPQPVFWLVGAKQNVPSDLLEGAQNILSRVPDCYVQRAKRYYSDLAAGADELAWRALGFLVDDARSLRFRRILTGQEPDPLEEVYAGANVRPDHQGLIPSEMIGDTQGEFALGQFDVELSRSMPATNSTYWLTPMIVKRPSCRVRLDPLRFAPRGSLPRMFYAMMVYGPPFDWTRIINLQNVEAVQWMADDDEQVEPELITELVWKPRDGEIILEIEQLPAQTQVQIVGARYLHAILDRNERCFSHLDGAIRWYRADELVARRKSRLDRVGSIGERTKIFRLDEPIQREDALDILSAFFVWNYDLAAYLNPDSPTARLSRGKRKHLA